LKKILVSSWGNSARFGSINFSPEFRTLALIPERKPIRNAETSIFVAFSLPGIVSIFTTLASQAVCIYSILLGRTDAPTVWLAETKSPPCRLITPKMPAVSIHRFLPFFLSLPTALFVHLPVRQQSPETAFILLLRLFTRLSTRQSRRQPHWPADKYRRRV